MSNNNTMKKIVIPAVAMLMVGSFFIIKNSTTNRNLGDDALLSLMKNDKAAFISYIEAGGDIYLKLPAIEGHTFTVAEGIAYFERTAFVDYLQTKKKTFIDQTAKKDYDMLSLTVSKNNPEMLKLLTKEKPLMDLKYGKNGWTLLHMASAECSSKMVGILRETGKLNWDTKATDGSTPLTLAATYDCLPVLSYWKEMKVDFNKKDGNGNSALSILKTKKDAALASFAKSFEPDRLPTSLSAKTQEPDFYKKRAFPKLKAADRSALVEPEDRPENAVETAEYTEFAD
jgi:hypothetical protein